MLDGTCISIREATVGFSHGPPGSNANSPSRELPAPKWQFSVPVHPKTSNEGPHEVRTLFAPVFSLLLSQAGIRRQLFTSFTTKRLLRPHRESDPQAQRHHSSTCFQMLPRFHTILPGMTSVGSCRRRSSFHTVGTSLGACLVGSWSGENFGGTPFVGERELADP
jgi:hypothetical protein